MPLSDAGLTAIIEELHGVAAVTDFDTTNARLGVGNGTAAFDPAHTDLMGGSTLRKGMDATFPSRAGDVITAKATFAPAEANFAWEEWGFFNAAAAGTMLCRKVEALGTKPPTQTWILTATMTWSNP